ncbi:MAG: hypothetical protein DRJ52_06040 [Thermoprotei archaeon]|nr:MAG: hypothetical protein DRJ52_06040 [Thermoprotei archaeon]
MVSTFITVFLAELGDKTQITVACIAAQYGAVKAFVYSVLGLATVTVINMFLGAGIRFIIPLNYIEIASAILFIAVGVFMLVKGSREEECGLAENVKGSALVALMEFGDKTQLAVISLAATTGGYLEVLVGALAAFTFSTLMASAIGGYLKKISGYQRLINVVSSLAFIVIGLALLLEALNLI